MTSIWNVLSCPIEIGAIGETVNRMVGVVQARRIKKSRNLKSGQARTTPGGEVGDCQAFVYSSWLRLRINHEILSLSTDPDSIGAIDPTRLYILAVSLQHTQSDADGR